MTLDDFRKIAEAATPGPWESHPLPVPVGISNATLHAEAGAGERWTNDFPPEIGSMATIEDAVFAATFDPERVLELLDENVKLRVQAEIAEHDRKLAWRDMDKTRARLAAVEKLYEQRCAQTVDNFTEGEELFLADLIKTIKGETND